MTKKEAGGEEQRTVAVALSVWVIERNYEQDNNLVNRDDGNADKNADNALSLSDLSQLSVWVCVEGLDYGGHSLDVVETEQGRPEHKDILQSNHYQYKDALGLSILVGGVYREQGREKWKHERRSEEIAKSSGQDEGRNSGSEEGSIPGEEKEKDTN